MRLACPNCDAQYEVDDAAIPDKGRDVQCSACGHVWFQLPQAAEAEAEAAQEEAELFGAAPAVSGVPAAAATAAAMPAAGPAAPGADGDGDSDDDGDDGDDARDAPAAAPAPAAPRRQVDEAVLAMLREEAERETAARRAEAARALEMQPDLGLAPAARAAAAAPAAPATAPAPAMSAPEAPADDEDRPVSQRPGARRDLLPDIEEINSTLRAGNEGRGEAEDETPVEAGVTRARSGFRTGFAAMLVIAGVLAALYVLAPRIAQHLPGSAAAMEAYVAGIDGLRLRLDGAIQGAVSALRGFSGQDG